MRPWPVGLAGTSVRARTRATEGRSTLGSAEEQTIVRNERAARVVTKTRATFGVKLPAQTLLEHPTLTAFTAQVGAARASEAPPGGSHG